jgi:hypothetical protein
MSVPSSEPNLLGPGQGLLSFLSLHEEIVHSFRAEPRVSTELRGTGAPADRVSTRPFPHSQSPIHEFEREAHRQSA